MVELFVFLATSEGVAHLAVQTFEVVCSRGRAALSSARSSLKPSKDTATDCTLDSAPDIHILSH